MLVTLSPAKTLDLEKTIPVETATQPMFIKDTEKIVAKLRKKTAAELAPLMGVGKDLAQLNYERYQAWKAPFSTKNARQCVFTFAGPVYQGFDWLAYKPKDYDRLQKTVRIISGLHGLLRPFDLIQPYRLDMHTPLDNPAGMAPFWREKVTEAINKEEKDLIVNAASAEYSDAIDFTKLRAKVITPLFKNQLRGKYVVIGLVAKKARGMFADYIVRNNITNIDDLKEFKRDGYTYDAKTSTDTDLVFLRTKK